MAHRNLFNLLEPTSCKAFWYSATELNFSRAAEKAGMTQSGVSKHISKLESQLKTKLFLRNPKNLTLTSSGKMLQEYLQNIWSEFESFNSRILADQFDLTGQVRYAMPESCLMSPHFSMLLRQREKRFPSINLSVTIAINEVVESLICQDQVDFGFMTYPSRHLLNKEFCFENYLLVGRKNKKLKAISDLSKMSFIGYPELKTIFELWKNGVDKKSSISLHDLSIRNTMNDMRGVVTMLLEGPNDQVTLLPEHCVLELLQTAKLYSLNPPGLQIKNQIYMVMAQEAPAARVQKIQNEFFEILKMK